jgi:hypothetical protein
VRALEQNWRCYAAIRAQRLSLYRPGSVGQGVQDMSRFAGACCVTKYDTLPLRKAERSRPNEQVWRANHDTPLEPRLLPVEASSLALYCRAVNRDVVVPGSTPSLLTSFTLQRVGDTQIFRFRTQGPTFTISFATQPKKQLRTTPLQQTLFQG